MMAGAAALIAHPAFGSVPDPSVELPAKVAGVAIPRSRLALRAAAFARKSCPEFLFNHCLRTFVFGALLMKRRHLNYRAEDAFIAAALHDLGLLPDFESPQGSFEVDGADAAEAFMRRNGRSTAEADRVWHAVELHDGKWALTVRQGPEAMLVALGAGTDVDGPDPDTLEASEIAGIVSAFPRLQFKQRFTSLLIAHCQRKPASQRATWLEGLCRNHAPRPSDDSVEREIAAAAFAE
jgi:HD domain